MSAPRIQYWDWLTSGKVGEAAVPEVAGWLADPSEFWQRVRRTIEEAGANDESARAAKKGIEDWLKDPPTPWQEAIGNCADEKLPDRWKGRRKEFKETAERFTEVVLRSIPRALDHYRDSRREMESDPKLSRQDVEVNLAALAITDRDYRWRFFGDPAIYHRRILHFPVAAVVGQGTSNPDGCILQMTIEVLEPGLGNAVRHPLAELSELKTDERFENAVSRALSAAAVNSGRQEKDRVTAGYFPQRFLEEGITKLDGGSAGGAFALAFGRVLKNQAYDQRVLVIASISDGEGQLGPVDSQGAGPDQSGPTFLECKARGIVAHNRPLPSDAPTRIDTVAVVGEQRVAMEDALVRAFGAKPANRSTLADENIRVLAIEDLPGRSQD